MANFEELNSFEYMGRGLMLFRDHEGGYGAVYILSGRSDSSQAREVEEDPNSRVISTKPTNPEVLAEGNSNLLLYPAFIPICNGLYGIIVGNGVQTESVISEWKYYPNPSVKSITRLSDAFKKPNLRFDQSSGTFINIHEHEPDKPNYTPRITGLITKDDAAICNMYIDEKGIDGKLISVLNLENGEIGFISTYSGENINPLPSFTGGPIMMVLPESYKNIQTIVEAVFHAVPGDDKKGQDDFRVAVAGVMYKNDVLTSYIINNKS